MSLTIVHSKPIALNYPSYLPTHIAGEATSRPIHPPNPTPDPSDPATAVILTTSPSKRNLRSLPSFSLYGRVPPSDTSRRDPSWPSAGPDTVPVAITSPVLRELPALATCAIICRTDQCRLCTSDLPMTVLALSLPPGSISTCIRTAYVTFSGSRRYGGIGATGFWPAASKGARASSVTTQGDIEVPKFLPFRGPRGIIS